MPDKKSNDTIYSIIQNNNNAFMDLTGRFPYKLSQGNEFIFIAFHANVILGTPIKNNQAHTLKQAWLHPHNKLALHTNNPNTWILDNEASGDLQYTMLKHNVQFQLVPPHNHRANLAERAIQTFKNHFKAGLSSLQPFFPITEWDRLLPQAFLTLNFLRQATANPNLSAFAYLFGNFDFNKTSLA